VRVFGIPGRALKVYYLITGLPPLPPLPRIFRIIELGRFGPQNPEPKRLRRHNPDNKGVRPDFWAGPLVWLALRGTALAGTIVKRSGGCAQGQMSQRGLWKTLVQGRLQRSVSPANEVAINTR